MTEYKLYIHTVDGGDAITQVVEAESEHAVIEKVYRSNNFYDFFDDKRTYRVNLSHVTKIVVTENRRARVSAQNGW